MILRRPTLVVLSLAAATTFSCGGNDGGGASPPPPAAMTGGAGGSRPGTGGSQPGGGSGGGGSGGGSGGVGGSAGAPGTGGGPGPNPTPTADGGTPPGSVDGGASAPPPAPDDDYGWLAKPVPVLWFTLPATPAIPAPGQPKTARPRGNLKVIQDHDGSPVTSIEGKPVALDFAITIEGRGSSSFTAGAKFMGQQGYNIEFDDGNFNGVGKSLLGMPQNADWALVTCVSDKTCIRNGLTYAIGRELVVPQGRWAPRFRWAEVYINGNYLGVYTVAEKPKDDKFRVNLPNVPDNTPRHRRRT